MRKAIIVIVMGVLGVVVWWALRSHAPKPPRTRYQFAKVERRDLQASVSATGLLSAVVTVAVGTETSGTVTELYVDYNSPVRKDQVIARIDPASREALLKAAAAELALSRAKLITRQADVKRRRAGLDNTRFKHAAAQAQRDKAKAAMDNAEKNMERRRVLVENDYISRIEYDTATTAFEEARAAFEHTTASEKAAFCQIASSQAELAMAQAQIQEAKAQVALKEAVLENRRVALDRTMIRSPVDGVVIDRKVDIGQTVAANFQAPTLFTIARDLAEMEVMTSVDEADIGGILVGQIAFFTVDAFPDRKFEGAVTQIRIASETVQNVVTYVVVIGADNSDLKLMPGMTADVEIVAEQKEQVLTVANAALRFKPVSEQTKESSPMPSPAAAAARRSAGSLAAKMDELAAVLTLRPDQEHKLKAAFEKMRSPMGGDGRKPAFTGGPPADYRSHRRRQMQNIILNILTSEQQAQYKQWMQRQTSHPLPNGVVWRLDGDGHPIPLSVACGLSNASYTEISGDGIEDGMQLIVSED